MLASYPGSFSPTGVGEKDPGYEASCMWEQRRRLNSVPLNSVPTESRVAPIIIFVPIQNRIIFRCTFLVGL